MEWRARGWLLSPHPVPHGCSVCGGGPAGALAQGHWHEREELLGALFGY